MADKGDAFNSEGFYARGYTVINGLSIGNTRMKLLAGALLFGLASVATVASAQSATLVGGGATLPAVGYVGDTSTRLVTPTSDSLFGAYAALAGTPAVSYCQTGSGGGKTVLAGNNPALNVNGTCTDPAATDPLPPPVTGFGAASLGLNLAQPHFAASDAPMSQAEYTNYSSGHSAGQPVQLPAISGAIAIVYQKGDLATQLKLTDAQVCGIFSGQITDWSDLDASVSGPIKVVFRSDGSGTSFAFSNHLSKVCGSSNPTTGTGGNDVATGFKTDQAYSVAAATYIPDYAASQGASGNPGVIAAIQDEHNDGAIGYAETANATGGLVSFAAIARDSAPTVFVDPSTYGGTVLPVAVQYNQVITGVDGNGRPTLDAVTPALPATSKCLSIVNPEDYATTVSGYPIVAVSYLLANSAGNGSDLANVRGFMATPYDTTLRSSVDTIGSDTGLSYVSGTDLGASKVNACVAN
jgi:phosphate transport system substrate-binding protein